MPMRNVLAPATQCCKAQDSSGPRENPISWHTSLRCPAASHAAARLSPLNLDRSFKHEALAGTSSASNGHPWRVAFPCLAFLHSRPTLASIPTARIRTQLSFIARFGTWARYFDLSRFAFPSCFSFPPVSSQIRTATGRRLPNTSFSRRRSSPHEINTRFPHRDGSKNRIYNAAEPNSSRLDSILPIVWATALLIVDPFPISSRTFLFWLSASHRSYRSWPPRPIILPHAKGHQGIATSQGWAPRGNSSFNTTRLWLRHPLLYSAADPSSH